MVDFQMIAFIMLLTYAAIIDLKTRKIPDHIPVLIILIGLIEMEPMSAVLGLIFVPLPFFIMALLKENSIGGGDIKLMGACGFYLGFQAGYVASVLGLTLAILIHFAYSVIGSKKANESIALAPYLGAGCLIAYFLVK
ncbi:prepilin peptidase [Fusibacter tunisiensis]|uniref:Leader peptidase (Prepilin peptidase)/N-methyltransferase n=1 Tax=Fusibacter tunisiensis TaxID=1008308 RepID=A0ABS2MU08_9FIRM|nr:A24 family peptidase [Fusibacter tunisiensis]MBM7562914.1 leader peptidase (prepilin peptidase)/N-methyltransferase [Fusibacter tunisiensis]